MNKADRTRRHAKESPMDVVLGIDIAKAKFDVALRFPDGRIRRKAFANTRQGFDALTRWLTREDVARTHAALEATGTYGFALAEYLHDAGHVVSLLNPAVTHAFAASQLRRAKTDRIDAALIAQYCATQRPAAWTPAPREIRELQGLIRRLAALHDMKTKETNRLAAGEVVAAVETSIVTVVDTLTAQIAIVQRQIRDHLSNHPGLREQRDLLTSIPGIGDATAALLLAELFNKQYRSARHAAAFAGLVPRVWESGTLRGKGRLVKTGSSRLRRAMYFPALAALRANPTLRALKQRFTAAGKPKMVIVGAAMRKLIHLAFGVLKSRRPYDPTHAHA
jgi:transposase